MLNFYISGVNYLKHSYKKICEQEDNYLLRLVEILMVLSSKCSQTHVGHRYRFQWSGPSDFAGDSADKVLIDVDHLVM